MLLTSTIHPHLPEISRKWQQAAENFTYILCTKLNGWQLSLKANGKAGCRHAYVPTPYHSCIFSEHVPWYCKLTSHPVLTFKKSKKYFAWSITPSCNNVVVHQILPLVGIEKYATRTHCFVNLWQNNYTNLNPRAVFVSLMLGQKLFHYHKVIW